MHVDINYHKSDWGCWFVLAEFAYNGIIHLSIEMTPLIAAEGQHEQMETAAPRLTSKLDKVYNPAATKWVESLLKTRREIVDRCKEAAARPQPSEHLPIRATRQKCTQ